MGWNPTRAASWFPISAVARCHTTVSFHLMLWAQNVPIEFLFSNNQQPNTSKSSISGRTSGLWRSSFSRKIAPLRPTTSDLRDHSAAMYLRAAFAPSDSTNRAPRCYGPNRTTTPAPSFTFGNAPSNRSTKQRGCAMVCAFACVCHIHPPCSGSTPQCTFKAKNIRNHQFGYNATGPLYAPIVFCPAIKMGKWHRHAVKK